MKRLLSYSLSLLVLMGTAVLSEDVVIGPEDDPYIVEDSTTTAAADAIRSGRVLSAASHAIDTVKISQLDCGMFPRICTYVDVLDTAGHPLGGMDADSFCVSFDGAPIDSFSVEALTIDSCGTSVCLVIDVSGSMNDNNKIGAARAAAHNFVDNMDIYDRVAIVKFSACWSIVQNFTSNKALLHSKINTLSAQSWTAAFDGIWKGVQITGSELGSKAVIALTDGMENRSFWCDNWASPDGLRDHDFSDDSTLICDLANSSGVPIYTISLGNEFDPQYLISFAGGTGGSYFHAPTGDDIDTIYTEIKERLCKRYLICFDSPDTVQNGDWHTTEICRKDDMQDCGPCDTASCQETDVPSITLTPATINLETTCQHWDTDVDICAWVTDQDTPQGDLEVKLFYRNADTVSYISILMTRTDSLYCGTIPAGQLTCGGDSVQYYITASDGQVTVSSPPLAPTYHHAIPICPNSPPTVFAGNDTTVSQCYASIICWSTSAGDPDGNLQTVEKITGPGTFNGSQICFTPTGTLDYEFVLKATDSCGLESFDTVVVYYSINNSPVANAGADQSLFLCESEKVCWPAGCSDVDGNLNDCSLISGPGTFYGDSICFTPTAPGTYQFVLQATDACGQVDRDTATIEITMNSAPVCTVPDDTTIQQCSPTQVCLPYSVSDVDDNLEATPCHLVSCPGSLVGGNWCYTPTGDETVVVSIKCEDTCGAFCQSQFTVTFEINEDPEISLGNDTSVFLCTSEEVCVTYSTSDADAGQSRTVSLISGFGTLDTVDSTVCFTPPGAGVYTVILETEDSCGATDRDTVNVTVTMNSAPVADAGSDQTLFQCTPTQICWAASCTDPDGNLTACQLIGPNGTYNGTNICFTPPASGSYDFVLRATDGCGLTDEDTVTLNITLNSAPVIAAQSDTSLFLCSSQQVCVSYAPSDADGLSGLTEVMVSGYGAIDTADNEICFTPTSSGSYQFIVKVTDPCGASDRDTVVANVTFGASAAISCPASDFDEFLCGADSIVQSLTVTPPSATVGVSYGTYAGGAVRFLADTAGTYVIRVIATEACGADTCDLVFNVDFNSPPVASAGADQSVFQCAPASICWAASCSDPDANLINCELFSGPGAYNGTQICFTPTGSGSYEFVLKATDACGAVDYDTVNVDVIVNSAPSVVAQADTSLFLCTPQPICVSYTPSDVDGPSGLTEAMLSGYGNIDTAANEICFTPTTSGTYQFTVQVTDSCGLTDQDVVEVSVTFGAFASINCPISDFDEFLCGADSIIQSLAITPSTATVTASYGTYAGGSLRFLADTAGTYVIRVIATEACGADTCDLVFNVDFNSPPVSSAGSDQSIFQCNAIPICWAASCSDPDANLTSCELFSGPGTYNGSQICFTPTGTGSYEFVLKATDACGATDYDTVNVDVTINSAPTVVAQADTSLFLCAPQQVCVSYTPGDADGLSGLTETMLAGYGAIDTANNQMCFTPTVAGTYRFIVGVKDACLVTARDTVDVTVAFGQFASITCPTGDFDEFLCSADSIIQPIAVTPSGATVTASYGVFDAGALRFLADTSGTYDIRLIATSSCGADTCDVVFNVDINSPPVANAGADLTRFQCWAQSICWTAGCTDPDGNLSTCELISGTGSYNGSQICFTPTGTGSFEFVLKATDACGAVDYDTVNVDVTINSAPTVIAQADTSLSLCTPQQICVGYTPADVDGLSGLTEAMVSGFGTIDTASNLMCFTPAISGSYEFIVGVTDSCGLSDHDTVNVTVSFGDVASITCPADTIFVSLCDTATVCNMLPIQPAGATVSPSFGTYAGGEHCFKADTSGIYVVEVIASAACGADTCQLVYKVDIGQAASITCPPAQSMFICEADTLCVPVSVITPGASISVTPVGYYSAGNVCFPADTSGHYVLEIIASTSCGSDTCQVVADIAINSNPVAADPTTPVDTSLCANGQICRQFSAGDVDGGTLDWARLSGDGMVSSSGLWCFNVTGDGAYSVTVEVADSCGAADTISMTYNVDVNSAPAVTLVNDTSVFVCAGGSYCFGYIVTDNEGNVSLEQLVAGTGTIDTINNQVCFSPGTSGTYQFIVEATDVCGAKGQDTINVTVNLGNAVAISCPGDTSLFLCGPTQICRPVGIPIDTNVVVSPIGSYSAGQVCFDADTAGHYVIKVAVYSDCGSDSCTFAVDVVMNANPVATNPGTPVDTFMCDPDQVCFQFGATDVDGGTLDWTRLSGDGTVTSTGLWCFNVTSDDSYSVSVEVSDACGAADTTTLTYNVELNTSPAITLENDTSVFVCTGGSYCFSYIAPDDENNVVLEELISGTGTLDTAANEVCFTPASNGTYQFIMKATDSCGATATDTINVTVAVGTGVTVTCPSDTAIFLCASEEICLPLGLSNAGATVTVSPVGYYSAGEVCFTPDTAGHYVIDVEASTACGSDDCQFVVDVTFNSNPIAVDPVTPVDTLVCAPAQVCYLFGATDVDGGTLAWTRLSGNGTVSTGGMWCFNATADGSYSVQVEVADQCGAKDTTTLTYNVEVNAAPVIAFGNDTSVFICDGNSYCFNYTVTDDEDNVTLEQLLSGPGTFDANGDEVCFAPTADGTYEFIVQATDACGAVDRDTINITVDLGTPVTVSCPADTSLFLCDPVEICRPVTVSDPGASVDVSPVGYYSGGQVCFTPDTSGHYVLTVEATAACGGQSCEVVVDVVLNSNPVADNPGAVVDTFVCATEDFCYAFTAADVDGGTLTWRRLSGDGSMLDNGLWCFTASISGSYSAVAEVEDSCGATDTVSHQFDVVINSLPTVAFGADTSVFMAAPGGNVCVSYTTDDADDNIAGEVLISGAGVVDSVANTVCFASDTNGVYVFILEVADDCGATDRDTIEVTITNNQPPVADAGDDLDLFLCTSEEVCFPVACSDPDNNLDTCYVVSSIGELEAGEICFTPSAQGVYNVVLRAVDESGASDQDTVAVTITFNSAPECLPVPNLTYFQCAPEQVSVPIGGTDIDDNFDHCSLISGPGSIVNGFWVHTPTGDEVDSVAVRCFDECGAFCEETFVVTFSINDRPVANAGADTSLFFCESGTLVSWMAGCTDPNNNLASCFLTTSVGTYSGGQISFVAPPSEGTYAFVLRAEDSCGLFDLDTAYVTLDYNEPPTLDLPPDFTAFLDDPGQACFGADIFDVDANLTSVTVLPATASYDTALGQICFQADTSGTYCFEITATDACPDCSVTDTVCVEIEIDECLQVQIEKVHNALQGQHTDVDIFLNGSGKELGGYDLLVQYEQTALMAMQVLPGKLIEDCGWEYFTWRFGASGQCGGCPDGLLRIVAMAETNNGAYHPGCYLAGGIGTLATIDFFVSNDRTLECQYIPVRFFWIECGDNNFSSKRGDTLWLSREVFDFEFNNITDYTYGFPGWVGAPDSCLLGGGPDKPAPIRCVDYTNGGVDIVCADSIDARGDLNLNGVANEIADAVLFTNYFIKGTDAFTISVPGQIAASDVNNDGIPLTVGDLVYLIRVVVGDAPPIMKVHPDAVESVEFRMADNLVAIAETEANVGAIHMIVSGKTEPKLEENASGMDLMFHFDGKETRILIYNIKASTYLTAGPIVRLNGSTAVRQIQAGSYDGRPMEAVMSSLPADFELSQNYPNPFNPTTKIRFGLPRATEWKLDIFNILGQRVVSFEGESDGGWETVEWDASRYASGVYLYRLRAGDFKDSKKMLLLK